MNKEQKEVLTTIFSSYKNVGDLDYVTGWYLKAAQFIQDTCIKVAFVSTNSIVQGLQTSLLWEPLFRDYNIKIHFAHRTFKWSNEAKGNAAVYCVIVGFASFDTTDKYIYDYQDIRGEAHEIKAKNINAYLIDAIDIFVNRKQNTICKVPEMAFGNMPADGGKLSLTKEEKDIILSQEPMLEKYIKRMYGSQEFINNIERFCYWLKDIEPQIIKQSTILFRTIKEVREIRLKSSRPKLAETPHLFAQITQPDNANYIIIPSVSSERRKYIPMGFMTSENIASNLCLIIPNGNIFHFGILMSEMHMAWVKTVCGRLKSDYRYSKDIVYNNYPWPKAPSAAAIKKVEEAAQMVLDARAKYPSSSLADLYDPLTMPPDLVKAHNALDKAVDVAYSKQKFDTEAKRMEFLFNLYEDYVAGV